MNEVAGGSYQNNRFYSPTIGSLVLQVNGYEAVMSGQRHSSGFRRTRRFFDHSRRVGKEREREWDSGVSLGYDKLTRRSLHEPGELLEERPVVFDQ